jgi:hypothetical protein
MPTDLAKLLSKYNETETGCWQWTGYKNHLGYGRANVTLERGKAKLMAVHRLAWMHHCGPVPAGQVVMHICDNPACINPAHLQLGTQADNLADMRAKGRHPFCKPPPPPEPPKTLPPIQDGVKFKLWLENVKMGVAQVDAVAEARRKKAG